MLRSRASPPYRPLLRLPAKCIAIAIAGLGLSLTPARAQSDAAAGCTLKNHVYTCDGAAFQKALAGAQTVSIETHNTDGVARSQLQELIAKKLAKTVATEGGHADLNFLLIPIAEQGVVNTSPGDVDLGTLRVYTAAADGSRGQLVWAETFSGQSDLPWPSVVHGLIQQFQSRFHIK